MTDVNSERICGRMINAPKAGPPVRRKATFGASHKEIIQSITARLSKFGVDLFILIAMSTDESDNFVHNTGEYSWI
jgi:hypothetical protein